MRPLDSNIIIYASKPGYGFLHSIINATEVCVSAISYIAGYHALTAAEAILLDQFFANIPMLGLGPTVLDRAIAIRRQKKMTLGDSLIAASALVHRCTLVTRNVSDFGTIPGLDVHDPFPARPMP
jgi:predicted nucleic acid-binding protein